MRITYNPIKRATTLDGRGLDFKHAREVFNGPNLTDLDERKDYREPRYITVGWLDARLVIVAWTPRRRTRRIISTR